MLPFRRLACCLLAFLLGLTAAGATPHQDALDAAQTLAREGSWTEARDHYAAALATAPDAASRRWCELWLADAGWRAEASSPQRWTPGWGERPLATFDALEKPFREGATPDDFWVALLTKRADLEDTLGRKEAWSHRSTVANHLASQPPSPEAATRYLTFLHSLLDGGRHVSSEEFQFIKPHLLQGTRVGPTADERAWCWWQLARGDRLPDELAPLAATHLHEQAAAWATARTAAQRTRWEAAVEADAFVWRTVTGWSPTLPPNTPADVPAVLAELKTLRRNLGDDPADGFQALRDHLQRIEEGLREPRLDVQFATRFAPATPVAFSYGASGLSGLTLTLDRAPAEEWLLLEDRPDPRSSGQALPHAERVREWPIAFPSPDRLAWQSAQVEAAPALPSGLYVLRIQGKRADNGEPIHWQRRFVVSKLRGLASLASATDSTLFLYAAADGQPIPPMEISGITRLRSSTTTWTARSDAQGAVALPPLDRFSRGLVAFAGGEPVWFNQRGIYEGEKAPLLIDVYTDRPLFRPGETARWKLIARERRDGRFVVPTDLAGLQFQIALGDTSLLDRRPLELNAYGTAEGEIRLPADARAGEAVLEISRGDQPDNRELKASSSLFQVDHFVPPAVVARLEVLGEPASLRPGRAVTVKVNASYFSGGAVVQAPAQLTLSPDYRTVDPLSREQLAGWREASQQPQHGTTDANGDAQFTVTIPASFPDTAVLDFSATVLPAGARPVTAQTSITLSSSGLWLDPLGWTRPQLARPGEALRFSALVRDGRDAPAAFRGRAQLVELRWSEVWVDSTGRVVPPPEIAAPADAPPGISPGEPADRTLVHAAYAERVVAEKPIASEADGRVDAEFTLPAAGLYRLHVFGEQEILPKSPTDYEPRFLFSSRRHLQEDDSRVSRRRNVLALVVADEKTSALALNPETSAVVTRREVTPGSPLPALGIARAGAEHAWLFLTGETDVMAAPIPLQGRLAWHTFDAPPSLHGEGRVEFAEEAGDTTPAETVSTRFNVSRSTHTLSVAVSPRQPEQRPGEVSDALVTVRNAAGEPVRDAELAVSTSDEAVHRLLGSEDTDATASFLQTTSTVQSVTSWSAGETLSLTVPRDPRPGSVINRAGVLGEDGEEIELSAFSVSADVYGYIGGASFTFAASRLVSGYAEKLLSPPRPEPSATVLGPGGPLPAITLRRNFASTAFWTPRVLTDAKGEARVTFTYPDNLTQWRIGAYAVGADGNTFGTAHAFARTSLPFQARLQLPQFLVSGDTAEVAATLVNRTAAPLRATATLAVAGVVSADQPRELTRDALAVAPEAETSAGWSVRANQPGEAVFTLTARAGNESDGLSLSLPVREDGVQQTTAAFSRLAADARESRFTLELPARLDAARTVVSVQLSPHYATTFLDALPYLIDYPYGCVEQTMSRFLPAVVVRKSLVDLGLDADAVERRILATESPADKKRREATAGIKELDAVVRQSLARLAEARSFHGFGWWPGDNAPDLWMTAYVAWGLSLAESAGVDLPESLLDDTFGALARQLTGVTVTDDRVAFAWAALARDPGAADRFPPRDVARLFTRAFTEREKLSASGRASLALAAPKFGTSAQAATLLRNLANGVQRASAAGLGETAHWGATRDFWRASESAVESTALTLLALLELDPRHRDVDAAVNWLALNRRSHHWSNTRDSAFAVLALTACLRQQGRLDAAGEVELLVNGTPVQRMTFSRESLLASPTTVAVPSAALRGGTNTFTLRRLAGANPVHAVAVASSWAAGDQVKPAGHLLDVARLFERQKAAPTLVGTLRITPEPLGVTGTAVASEEVTARVTLTVPNELEYVMIEVPKPAGCEPLNPLSGWDARLVRVEPPGANRDRTVAAAGGEPAAGSLKRIAPTILPPPSPDEGRALYREERADRSVFFLAHLEAGTWELRFGLRAVTPGDFRALPVTAAAMYAPEITANSDARRLTIQR